MSWAFRANKCPVQVSNFIWLIRLDHDTILEKSEQTLRIKADFKLSLDAFPSLYLAIDTCVSNKGVNDLLTAILFYFFCGKYPLACIKLA